MTTRCTIAVLEPEDNFHAVIEAKLICEKAGFDSTNQSLIATVVSELGTNILRYAGKGEIILEVINQDQKTGIEIQAVDSGPGIKNIKKAFQDHYTTTKNSLGLGLSSLKRIMDEFTVDSKINHGTVIITRKWK